MGRMLRTIRLPARLMAERLIGTITHVPTDEHVVALTFDDGPHPEFTPRLLDILERHDARGTFFCIGKYVAENQEIVRRAADAGHALGNHSWDHPSFPLISRTMRSRNAERPQRTLNSGSKWLPSTYT